LLCRAVDWNILPHEIREEEALELEKALAALTVYDAFRQYATDLEGLTKSQARIIQMIERLRDVASGRRKS